MAVGSATLDFGASPGSQRAQVDVTGQSGILATSKVEAFKMAQVTADHNDYEHILAPIRVTCGVPTVDVGFTIFAVSEWCLTGTFRVEWVWV